MCDGRQLGRHEWVSLLFDQTDDGAMVEFMEYYK